MKMKGTRKSVKFIIPSAVQMQAECAYLVDHDDEPVVDFEVDSRAVVIPATKGRIVRHRPRIERWRATFEILIFVEEVDPNVVKQLLEEAGQRNGVGDFRPQKGGPMGRFHVIAWESQKERTIEPPTKKSRGRADAVAAE